MRLTATPLLIAVTAISTATVLAEIPASSWASTGSLSLIAGVAALAMMGMAATLASRWHWLEGIFGGLDRIYEVHKWLGVWALALASFHLVFKAGGEGWQVASILPLPPYWTRLLRQLSYVALVGIVLLALNRNIPYGVWRWWHKLSGPAFVIVVLHWLSFRSPIALASPAGLWLAACAVLGLAGAAYKLLLYRFVSPHAEYELQRVEAGPSSVVLEMRPLGPGLDVRPGQFGFLRLLHPGLREPHPFTLAGTAAEGDLVRFIIRASGDYTSRLVAEARPGMRAEIHGPFGRFRRPGGAGPELWIAGGVGLAPFVAWLEDPAGKDFHQVTLLNCQAPGREPPGTDEVMQRARAMGVDWLNVPDPGSPSFHQRFAELARHPDLQISVCGPPGLLARVRQDMARHAIPKSRLHYERFQFR